MFQLDIWIAVICSIWGGKHIFWRDSDDMKSAEHMLFVPPFKNLFFSNSLALFLAHL